MQSQENQPILSVERLGKFGMASDDCAGSLSAVSQKRA
jgi:hypothetical protein